MNDEWQRDVDPARTAFFLDVDGTLLGFKDRPEDVVADGALLDLLERLSQAAGGALALVSGRMIADLDRIVAPLVLPAAGVHGAEMRFADGHIERGDTDALRSMRPTIEAFAASRDGLRLEDKGSAIAIHYRQAPQWQPDVEAFASTVSAEGIDIQHGKFVAEVKASRSHKGDAIARFMQAPPFTGRKPLFIGDDLTDEHGFRTVNALEGIAVKVTAEEEKSDARYRLNDTGAVRCFIENIVR